MLIVGLGNPGEQYKNTRHNIGFHVLDYFKEEQNLPEFKFSKKFNSLITEGKINEIEDNKSIVNYKNKSIESSVDLNKIIILVKPQTFMNNSGQAVKRIFANYKLQTTDLIVVHDDIDIDLGKIKIVKNRGSARHKGIESIIKELKSKDFIRFRLGIKPKQSYRPVCRTKKFVLQKFVLQKFNREEEKIVKEVIKKSAEAIVFFLNEGIEKAMTKFNS